MLVLRAYQLCMTDHTIIKSVRRRVSRGREECGVTDELDVNPDQSPPERTVKRDRLLDTVLRGFRNATATKLGSPSHGPGGPLGHNTNTFQQF